MIISLVSLFFWMNNLQQDKVQYAYKIDGFQEDWIESKKNKIRIVSLPYGNFKLHIKGRMPNGRFSKQELVIPIIVKRPFYLKWWFFGLILFTIIGSTWLFLNWRTVRLTKTANDINRTRKKTNTSHSISKR